MKTEFEKNDPMEEIYAIRRRRSEMFGHDVGKIIAAACERMRKDIAAGSRSYVTLPVVRRAVKSEN